jgi:hypothetical protein
VPVVEQPSGTVTLVFTAVEGACSLRPETWERASAEGREMSLEEAADSALSPA